MCPKYEKAAEILGKRWTGLIVRSLVEHPRRFSEITSYVPGLSDRLLSERLQALEAEGILERRVLPQRPVAVAYALTEKGHDLRGVVEALQVWADCWIAEPPAKASVTPPRTDNSLTTRPSNLLPST